MHQQRDLCLVLTNYSLKFYVTGPERVLNKIIMAVLVSAFILTKKRSQYSLGLFTYKACLMRKIRNKCSPFGTFHRLCLYYFSFQTL